MSAKGKTASARETKRRDAQAQVDKQRNAQSKAPAKEEKTKSIKGLTPAQLAVVEAKAALDAEAKEAVKVCYAEVMEVLKKHNCRLHAVPQMVSRQDGTFGVTANATISTLPAKLPEEGTDDPATD